MCRVALHRINSDTISEVRIRTKQFVISFNDLDAPTMRGRVHFADQTRNARLVHELFDFLFAQVTTWSGDQVPLDRIIVQSNL